MGHLSVPNRQIILADVMVRKSVKHLVFVVEVVQVVKGKLPMPPSLRLEQALTTIHNLPVGVF